ncbi:hypothetical protein OPQ81_010373 [Rhizoctonia solani]|nr:hypothetical protein OPQ81_010373 [Rhizoctonia solani]
MDSKPSSLSVISPELVIQILHYCEYPSILTFSATCKAYYELVTKSTSLQLHIELEANGLELVKGSFQRGATYSAILKDLRRFRDAWLDLDLTEPAERLSQDHPPLTFDFTFNEFTADPGQELLAILSRDTERDAYVHVHLCSSATGLAHPLARYPRLTAEFDFNPPYFWPGFSIDVMGHIVLSKVSHPQDHIYELLIWDWRSGVLLHRISSRGGICDFTFLDQRHLVVLSGSRSGQERLDTLELLIYALSNDALTHLPFYNGGQLRVVDFPISQPILSLEFPRIKESSKISETGFFLRSDPTPGCAIYVDSAAFACSYAVTLGMTFHFHEAFDNWESPPYYRALLDGRFLLDQIRENPGNETKVLPWSSWGTCATRWFIAPDEPDHWIAWMSGSRFITPVLNRPYYCIFDFSPPTVRRFRDRFGQLYPDALDHLVDNSDLAMADGFHDLERLGRDISYFCETSPSAHEFFAITVGDDNPSVIETDEYFGFEERIISRLPYRLVFKTNNRINHEGWQLIGDYIVGISSREASEVLTVYKLKK